MRASATILALLLVAGAAAAQEQRKPDYSRPTLMRIFVVQAPTEEGERVRYRMGVVDFNALGTSWRFNYLPALLMPLSGTETGVTQTWPDPFALTGTQIATSPRAWRTRRAMSQELERIEATERAKVRVNVERK